jgi:hypothetical protein
MSTRRTRNRRGSLRVMMELPLAVEAGAGQPWLHDKGAEPPAELVPDPRTLERARRKLNGSRKRRASLSTGGLGTTLPAGSDLMPHDRVTITLGLGSRWRPLAILAALPARVVRAREVLDGLEVGLAFEAAEPAIERRVRALIQARERRGG